MSKQPSAALLFFLLLLACGLWRAPEALAAKVDKIIAVVNSDIVTEDELNTFMKVAAMDPDPAFEPAPGEAREFYLDRLIEDKLILQEAQRLQIRVDNQAIADRIREIKQRAGTEADFEEALKAQGVSLNELRRKMRDQYLVYAATQREVTDRVIISPKEITDYFQAHPEEFMTREAAVVDSIFVDDAVDLATIQEKIKEGIAFLEIAAEFSKKSNLGLVHRGQLKKDLEDVVFNLTPGRPSAPFAVKDGWYIFVVREFRAASARNIDEVKDTIQEKIFNEKLRKAMREWLEALKEKAYISVREE